MPGPQQAERERVLELINNEFNNRIQQQATAGAAIDTKTTLIVGFTVVATQILLTQNRAEPWSGLAFGFFGVAFIAGVLVVRLRKYKTVPNPSEIMDYFNANSANGPANLREHVLAKLVGTKVGAIAKNGNIDRRKAYGWWAMVVAFFIAVVLSIVSVVEAPSGQQQRHQQRHGRGWQRHPAHLRAPRTGAHPRRGTEPRMGGHRDSGH
jgi:hypothetical protein